MLGVLEERGELRRLLRGWCESGAGLFGMSCLRFGVCGGWYRFRYGFGHFCGGDQEEVDMESVDTGELVEERVTSKRLTLLYSVTTYNLGLAFPVFQWHLI